MKKFTLYLSEEKHAYLEALARKNETNINKLINSIIDKSIANEEIYSMELKFNTTVEHLIKVLNEQSKGFNTLNIWHKIHAEQIKELLNIGYEDD